MLPTINHKKIHLKTIIIFIKWNFFNEMRDFVISNRFCCVCGWNANSSKSEKSPTRYRCDSTLFPIVVNRLLKNCPNFFIFPYLLASKSRSLYHWILRLCPQPHIQPVEDQYFISEGNLNHYSIWVATRRLANSEKKRGV